MKSVCLLVATAAFVNASANYNPISLPAELYSDVNKGPHEAVNIYMEADDSNAEGKQIQISQQLAALYGASAIQEFGARRSFRNRHSFLQAAPGAASGGASSIGAAGGAGGAAGVSGAAGGAGDSAGMVAALSGLLDQVTAQAAGSGSQATGSVAGGAGGSGETSLTQDMMAKQAKINADLEKAAIMNSDATQVWASPAEKALQTEIRAAMKSSSPKASTLGKVRAAIFGGSHATSSFLSPQSAINSAKISPAELQKVGEEVVSAVNSEFSAPRVNSACPSCNNVNYGSCPNSFESSASGVCTPTSSYTGFCNRPFLNLGSQLEKMEYEYLCETCYPCSA